MTKLTLNDISSILSNPVGAATAINVNNALIETAIEKTLSRDGTSPNSMEANLDMNSNRVINLPSPLLPTEPVRLGDLPDLTGSDIIFNGMEPAVYDPTSIVGDVFDMDNMVEGSLTKILTAAERAKIATGASLVSEVEADTLTSINAHAINAYGAVPSSTAVASANVVAIQEAANAAEKGELIIPAGLWYINSLITLKSNTIVKMSPGSTIKCYVAGWTGDKMIFRNENHTAVDYTDENIHLEGPGLLDATGMTADTHMWYMRYVTNSSFKDATGTGGGNVTAFLACRRTVTAYAKALDVGNCGFDHWDGPEDGLVFACEVDGSPAQGIQATACATDLSERHGKNMRFLFNTVRNVTTGAGTASAIIFNTGMSSATMSECLSMGNKVEDCDLGVVFEGLGENRHSKNDTLVRVTGLPIFFNSTFGAPSNCTVESPTLIDCDHAVANIALISLDGTRLFVTGLQIRNTGGVSYDLVARFVSGSTSVVELVTGNAGASGYYTDSGTNQFKFYFPIKATTVALEARGVTYDKVGATAYATDGRKAAEGAGTGTGLPVWWNGTNWLTFHDNSTLAD